MGKEREEKCSRKLVYSYSSEVNCELGNGNEGEDKYNRS